MKHQRKISVEITESSTGKFLIEIRYFGLLLYTHTAPTAADAHWWAASMLDEMGKDFFEAAKNLRADNG